MKVRVARSALSDLQRIRAYYLEQGVPGIGIGFVNAILNHAEMLVEQPDVGRKVPEFDQEHIRELIHAPFRIVYLRDTSTISLVRAWRSERLLQLP